MAIEYFCAYHSYRDSLMRSGLSHSEIGRLFLSLLEYSETGTEPDLPGKERQVFAFMAADIDRTKRRYAETSKNRSEAAKRGRANAANAANAAKSTNAHNANENANANDILSSSSARAREDDFLTGLVDEGMAKVSEAYESNIGLISPSISESMRSYLDLMDADCVVEAIHVACSNNARNWRYISKVLENKLSAGVRTMEQWRAQEAERQNTKGSREKTNTIDAAWEDGGKMTKQEFSEFWVRLRTLYPYDYRTDSAVPMWVGALREVTADKAEAALKAHYDASPKRAPLPEDIAKSAKSATGGSLLQRAIRAGRGETA